jgi:hypothetical protein
MKGALIGLFLGMATLVLLYYGSEIKIMDKSIDVHIADTYLVLSYLFAFGFVVVYLGLFFAIGGLIGTGFRRISYWLLFLLFAGIVVFYFFIFFNIKVNT